MLGAIMKSVSEDGNLTLEDYGRMKRKLRQMSPGVRLLVPSAPSRGGNQLTITSSMAKTAETELTEFMCGNACRT